MPKPRTFQQVIEKAFQATYPVDGIDASGIKRLDEWSIDQVYIAHPITRVTSFLGLPNRAHHGSFGLPTKPSWANIGKNFIGWRDDASILLNVLLIPVMVPLNIVSTPIKFAVNILKLLTEFLPQVVGESCALAAAKILHKQGEILEEAKEANQLKEGMANKDLNKSGLGNAAINILLSSVFYGLKFGAWLAKLACLAGRAITSPFKSARETYNWGARDDDGWLGRTKGVLAATVTLAFSSMVYAILFPFTANIIFTNILPAVLPHIPTAITYAAAWLARAVTPVLTAIGTPFTPALTAIGKLFGIAAASPASYGLALGLIPLGNVVNIIGRKISEAWSRLGAVPRNIFFNFDRGQEEAPRVDQPQSEPKNHQTEKPNPNAKKASNASSGDDSSLITTSLSSKSEDQGPEALNGYGSADSTGGRDDAKAAADTKAADTKAAENDDDQPGLKKVSSTRALIDQFESAAAAAAKPTTDHPASTLPTSNGSNGSFDGVLSGFENGVSQTQGPTFFADNGTVHQPTIPTRIMLNADVMMYGVKQQPAANDDGRPVNEEAQPPFGMAKGQ